MSYEGNLLFELPLENTETFDYSNDVRLLSLMKLGSAMNERQHVTTSGWFIVSLIHSRHSMTFGPRKQTYCSCVKASAIEVALLFYPLIGNSAQHLSPRLIAYLSLFCQGEHELVGAWNVMKVAEKVGVLTCSAKLCVRLLSYS